MPATEFTLADDFPPVDYDQWRSLAEADLKGASFERKLVTRTYEGIDVQPVYTQRDWPSEEDPAGFPGLPPFVRGSHPLGSVTCGWDLRQEHAHPDLEISNRAILEDVKGGVTSLLLRLDFAARNGLDPDDPQTGELAGCDGVMVYHVSDLEDILRDVDLATVGVALEAGAAFLPAAALLTALWGRREVALDEVRGAFNADPFAVLARDGQLPYSAEQGLAMMSTLAKWTAANCPRVTAIRVGTAAYHHAGAAAAQDLGFSMATGVAYLRAMNQAGLDVSAAARQILFSMSVGTHHFLAIAKLRAARRLWARVVEVCGGSPAARAMRLHTRTSKRVITERDPYVNLLRNTAAVFAGGVAGSESITSAPFDSACGLPDEFSRRIARNTALVLQEEAHLNRVIDPAGGSWYLERLTDQLAEKGWEFFQEIERRGGMLAVIQSGWAAEQIAGAFAPRAKEIARRKSGITGVSEFPNIDEQPVSVQPTNRPALHATAAESLPQRRCAESEFADLANADDQMTWAVDAAAAGASLGQLVRPLQFHADPVEAAPLAPHSFAAPFEELRDASDAWLDVHGRRPRVFLANLGPVAHHTARAAFSKNFFEAGGFEAITNDGFADAESAAAAFRNSGANVAVICSSDKIYEKMAAQAASALKSAGARTVVLAGNPGTHEASWREAGVDRFIFIKCDVLAALRELLQEEGVLDS